MSNPWFYSLIYNGVYMLPNMLLALASRAPSIRR
jgi:thiamine transporter ThiT